MSLCQISYKELFSKFLFRLKICKFFLLLKIKIFFINEKKFYNKLILLFLKITFVLIFSVLEVRDILKEFLKKEIETDNLMSHEKEKNIDFSQYSTTIKPIAIYNYGTNIINETKNINNSEINIEDIEIKKLEEQIILAKTHGIYGFAFYYFCFEYKNSSNKFLNIILKNKNFKINFLLIVEINSTKIDEKNNNISRLFIDIKKFIVDQRYIKFYNKSVIVFNQDDINRTDIFYLREKFRNNNLGEIYILSLTNNYNQTIDNNSIYNGLCYSPSYISLEKVRLRHNKTISYFYTHLLYFNLLKPPLNNTLNNNLFRMSISMSKHPIYANKEKTYIFWDYSPEKYFFLNKIIIDWTKKNYNRNNQYIFIDDFNNLEKDKISGYANINAFSKALYGLPVILDLNNNFNIKKLEKEILVLIQVHIYYTDLLEEIVEKVNNIPVPYDLYITTNTQDKKIYIENYLKENSNANNYEILITPNKGRDVIPFLLQLKDILFKYKYLCHLHTKKHGEKGKYWQHYLYENLLGNKNIIKQILSDFENHDKLGFIFPEHFYVTIGYAYNYNRLNWYYINNIFEILFPNMKIKAGKIINYPVGNMFWARIDAIYQIFTDKIIKLVPKERGQKDGTILHAIERIWVYLVKLNGFYYKTIFYYI